MDPEPPCLRIAREEVVAETKRSGERERCQLREGRRTHMGEQYLCILSYTLQGREVERAEQRRATAGEVLTAQCRVQ
jgi:hypothetical protein